MRRRPVVISPITTLLQRDDAEITLISVELWPSETIVRLAALVPDSVAEESEHEAALECWAATDRSAPVPLMPGERRLQDIVVSLSDDVATTYRLKTFSLGGSGRMFRGDWHFTTAVPEAAKRLMVEALNTQNGSAGSTELAL